MSPRPVDARLAASGELLPCAICGRPRWFHSQGPVQRRAEDWRDDGHSFRKSLGKQARLPFGEQSETPQMKKPPHKGAMQKAEQKKPMKRQEKIAAKPAKRSVA